MRTMGCLQGRRAKIRFRAIIMLKNWAPGENCASLLLCLFPLKVLFSGHRKLQVRRNLPFPPILCLVVGGEIRALSFRDDLLYANGSDGPHFCLVVSKNLLIILVSDSCDGDTTNPKLTLRGNSLVFYLLFILRGRGC